MGKDGTGLSDTMRSNLTLIFAIFNSVSASIMALAGPDAAPRYVVIVLTVVGNAILVIMVKLGIRDATSAAISKTVDKDSTNTRNIRDSVARGTNTPPTQ